jgi:hypothetical protein
VKVIGGNEYAGNIACVGYGLIWFVHGCRKVYWRK